MGKTGGVIPRNIGNAQDRQAQTNQASTHTSTHMLYSNIESQKTNIINSKTRNETGLAGNVTTTVAVGLSTELKLDNWLAKHQNPPVRRTKPDIPAN